MVTRAEIRDCLLFGGGESIGARHETRYVPGQKIYLDREEQRSRATIVIDNSDPENLTLLVDQMDWAFSALFSS